jgi:hypothetical protein
MSSVSHGGEIRVLESQGSQCRSLLEFDEAGRAIVEYHVEYHDYHCKKDLCEASEIAP